MSPEAAPLGRRVRVTGEHYRVPVGAVGTVVDQQLNGDGWDVRADFGEAGTYFLRRGLFELADPLPPASSAPAL